MPRIRATVGVLTPRQRRLRNQRRLRENNDERNDTENIPPVQPMPELPKALVYDHRTFEYLCNVGTLNIQCQNCSALKFPKETKGMCCSNGKVDLQPLPQLPAELSNLLNGRVPEAEHFLENIRKYNSAFQLTSFGCNEVRCRGWNPNFRIQGQVCHLIGPLEPGDGHQPSFLQIYFMDSEADQIGVRNSVVDGLRPDIILSLQELLHTHNTYVQQLKSAYEFARGNFPAYKIVINEAARPVGEHQRRYNAPTTNEVAVLMPNDPVGNRDIVLHTRNNQLQRISELHKAYDALQYPLLLPHGTDGWSLQLKLTSTHKITQLQYYCFHFFTRPNNFLLLARRLLQQYFVDAYAKIECERLQLTLNEASVSSLPHTLRSLFAVLLTQTFPSNPVALWDEFKTFLSEDFLRDVNTTEEQSENMALINIEDMVVTMGGPVLENLGLPKPSREDAERSGNDYRRETMYNVEEEKQKAQHNLQLLTPEQLAVFMDFTRKLEENRGGLFFLDAPGGCGKTFLIETILANIRGENKIAIATASSGLAATLLPGGRTVHSTFKVPLNISNTDTPMCSIKKGTALSRLLQEASVLIIDEAPMLHRKVLEAVDRTLQDIRSSHEPMGSLLTLLCGDFRQILPVVPNGTRANVIDACFKKSQLWQFVTTYKLTTNMRVALTGDQESRHLADMLLHIGNGTVPLIDDADVISLGGFGITVENEQNLINCVFPELSDNYHCAAWLTQRAILAPLNETVRDINAILTEMLPGPTHSYKAINTIVNEEEAMQYPIEFLNSIEISGLPPHNLILKVGMPVMILRSLNPPRLMNGTRCIVTSCNRNIVEVEVAVGAYAGEKHLIPRIPLQPSDTVLPFTFQRRQFPLQPCFAMTINKSQGQSLKTVGIHLRQPVFSHGMLYVALSRTGNSRCIYILATHGSSRNVVYKEIL